MFSSSPISAERPERVTDMIETLNSGKKENAIRRGIFAAVLLLFAVLQNTEGCFPTIFGARCLLLVPATVCIAMHEKEVPALFLGLFAGALWDINAMGNNFHAFFLTVTAFAVSTLMATIMRSNIVTASILTFTSLVLYNGIYWIVNVVMKGIDSPFYYLFRFYVPGIIYTMVLLPFIFLFTKFIADKFHAETL